MLISSSLEKKKKFGKRIKLHEIAKKCTKIPSDLIFTFELRVDNISPSQFC